MRGYVDASNGQIHYRREGDSGPDIVLLHCANFSSNLYERALPHLGERARVWAFDAPGVGLSDSPPEPSIPQIAGWLREAFDALGIERPVIAGLHTGCRIALQIEQQAGEPYLSAAVLTGIGPLSEDYAAAHPPRGPHLNLDPDAAGTQWDRALERYRTVYPDENPPTEPDGWLQHLFVLSSLSKVVPKRLPWPAGGYIGEGVDQTFRNLACPVLVMNTPEDLFCATDEDMAGWNPNGELRVLTGIGPHPMLREPQRYAEEILGFLERNGLLGT